MNRRLLLGLAIAAIVAGIVLFFATRGDGSAKKPAGTPATADNATPERGTPTPTRGQPARTKATDPTVDPSPTNTYTLEDGTIVRDHRAAGTAPYVRPTLPREDASPIQPHVTSKIMAAIRPVVLTCMQKVPDSAFADDQGVVETRASVSIDAQGNLTVLELGPAVSGIDEDASADALDCIRAAAANIHVHVDSAPVPQATLAFAIRPLQYRKHAQ